MISETKPSVRDAYALAFAMVFPTVMAWTYFVALAQSSEGPRRAEANPAIQAAYGLGKIVQFCFPVLYLRLSHPQSLRLGRPTWRGLRLGLGFGLLVALGILLLYRYVLTDTLISMGTRERVREKVEEFGAGTPGKFILLALFIAGAHSLLEEYYWRWFVFGGLRRLVPLVPAMLL